MTDYSEPAAKMELVRAARGEHAKLGDDPRRGVETRESPNDAAGHEGPGSTNRHTPRRRHSTIEDGMGCAALMTAFLEMNQ